MAYYDRVTTKHARANECEPARCPECGGLECLCRPRFFAGQLLTDEDLNLLDRYIVGKNRLHNRYLHGWGVVCGLEVVCHPCNMVTVRPGYALGPCGEDIVVCRDDVVDVCALIKQCRDKERRRWECDPYGVSGDDPNCRDVTEEWVLSVRYEEKPSRGVTALKGASGASCNCGGSSACGCGGSGGGGCGCGGGGSCGCGGGRGGSSAKQATRGGCATTGAKAPPAQCEPTVTCEGYVYEVCKLPVRKTRREQRDMGALAERVLECLACLREATPEEPGPNARRAEWHQWCCSLKESLLDYLASHPVYDCSLAERIAQFSCPDPNSPQFDTDAQYRDAVKAAVQESLAPVGAAYLFYCICSALLPPCPGPVEDPRVPLAVVTVRKDNCRVVRVCNLSQRKFATTLPNLQYWLSPLPFGRQFRKVLEELCCRAMRAPQGRPGTSDPEPRPGGTVPPPPTGGTVPQGGAVPNMEEVPGDKVGEARVSSSAREAPFVKALKRAWEGRHQTLGGETLFLGTLGATDQQGRPFMSEEEMEDPFTLLMLNRVLGPVMRAVPEEAPEAIRGAAASGAEGARRDEEVSALRAQLAELQKTVKGQQERLNAHEARLKRGK